MLFGMPALIELNSLEECAALCMELGLDFVEISMSLPQYTVEAMDVAAFKEIADQYGIFFTIHLDENVHFLDFNSYTARTCRQYLRDTIGIARALGVPAINTQFHRGEHFTLPDRKVELFALYKDHYRKSVDAFRNLCEEAIGTSDVKICIENCNGYPDFQKEALAILLASPSFGLTFDVGHNHGCGGLDESYIIKKRTSMPYAPA